MKDIASAHAYIHGLSRYNSPCGGVCWPAQKSVHAMTISREDRARDRHNALLSMMTSLGAQAIDAVNFPSFDPPLSEVKRTTWDDLVDFRFVEVVSRWNGNTYALTGKGWYAGLKATGKINDPGAWARRPPAVCEQLGVASDNAT